MTTNPVLKRRKVDEFPVLLLITDLCQRSMPKQIMIIEMAKDHLRIVIFLIFYSTKVAA